LLISLFVVVSVRLYVLSPFAVVLEVPPVPPFVPVPGTFPTLRLEPLKVSVVLVLLRGTASLAAPNLYSRPAPTTLARVCWTSLCSAASYWC